MPKIAALYDNGLAVLSTFELDEVRTRILAMAHDYRKVAIPRKFSQAITIRNNSGSVGRKKTGP